MPCGSYQHQGEHRWRCFFISFNVWIPIYCTLGQFYGSRNIIYYRNLHNVLENCRLLQSLLISKLPLTNDSSTVDNASQRKYCISLTMPLPYCWFHPRIHLLLSISSLYPQNLIAPPINIQYLIEYWQLISPNVPRMIEPQDWQITHPTPVLTVYSNSAVWYP